MRLSADELLRRIEPTLREAGLWSDAMVDADRPRVLRIIELLKPRAKTLRQFVDDARPFLAQSVDYDPAAVAKHLGGDMPDHLLAYRDALRTLEPFEPAALEAALRELAVHRGIKTAALIHATRVAVTGRTVSPGLFDVIELIGRDRSVARLSGAVKI